MNEKIVGKDKVGSKVKLEHFVGEVVKVRSMLSYITGEMEEVFFVKFVIDNEDIEILMTKNEIEQRFC